jgi:hypothetical protein
MSAYLSVRPSVWNNSTSTEWTSTKFYGNNGYGNAPLYYDRTTFPALFVFIFITSTQIPRQYLKSPRKHSSTGFLSSPVKRRHTLQLLNHTRTTHGVLRQDTAKLTFMWACIVNVFFQVYQQDVTLYNIIYCCQCCTFFRRFLRPSSGAQNCTHSIWYMSSLLAATASGSSKQAWHIPDVVCTVLSSWWWAEKPPGTCTALTVIKNTV